MHNIWGVNLRPKWFSIVSKTVSFVILFHLLHSVRHHLISRCSIWVKLFNVRKLSINFFAFISTSSLINFDIKLSHLAVFSKMNISRPPSESVLIILQFEARRKEANHKSVVENFLLFAGFEGYVVSFLISTFFIIIFAFL